MVSFPGCVKVTVWYICEGIWNSGVWRHFGSIFADFCCVKLMFLFQFFVILSHFCTIYDVDWAFFDHLQRKNFDMQCFCPTSWLVRFENGVFRAFGDPIFRNWCIPGWYVASIVHVPLSIHVQDTLDQIKLVLNCAHLYGTILFGRETFNQLMIGFAPWILSTSSENQNFGIWRCGWTIKNQGSCLRCFGLSVKPPTFGKILQVFDHFLAK